MNKSCPVLHPGQTKILEFLPCFFAKRAKLAFIHESRDPAAAPQKKTSSPACPSHAVVSMVMAEGEGP